MPLDPQLLDELARVFARVALDALLREAAERDASTSETEHDKQDNPGTQSAAQRLRRGD